MEEIDNRGGIARLCAVPIENAFDRNGNLFPAAVHRQDSIMFPVFPGVNYTFNEQVSETVQGTLYTVTIKGKCPKNLLDYSKANILANSYFLVYHQDNMGDTYVSGTKMLPMKATINKDTGEEKADMNSVSFEFKIVETAPSLKVVLDWRNAPSAADLDD